MSDKLTRVDYFAERAKIGEIIAEIRLDKRMTQDELAERSGLSRSSLIAIEKGRANFTIDAILDIANGLGVSVELIFLKAFFSGKAVKIDARTSEKIVNELLVLLMKHIE